MIPRKGRPDAARRQIERGRAFRKMVRWRTGCEGRISCLKRDFGWRRTRIDGLAGARTWCGHGVFAHNLIKISGLTRESRTTTGRPGHHPGTTRNGGPLRAAPVSQRVQIALGAPEATADTARHRARDDLTQPQAPDRSAPARGRPTGQRQLLLQVEVVRRSLPKMKTTPHDAVPGPRRREAGPLCFARRENHSVSAAPPTANRQASAITWMTIKIRVSEPASWTNLLKSVVNRAWAFCVNSAARDRVRPTGGATDVASGAVEEGAMGQSRWSSPLRASPGQLRVSFGERAAPLR